jgi:hypothetical protein
MLQQGQLRQWQWINQGQRYVAQTVVSGCTLSVATDGADTASTQQSAPQLCRVCGGRLPPVRQSPRQCQAGSLSSPHMEEHLCRLALDAGVSQKLITRDNMVRVVRGPAALQQQTPGHHHRQRTTGLLSTLRNVDYYGYNLAACRSAAYHSAMHARISSVCWLSPRSATAPCRPGLRQQLQQADSRTANRRRQRARASYNTIG